MKTETNMREAIKRYLKGWNIPRDLCLDMSAWKAAIDVTCLVSTLAYPNLLGTKMLCCCCCCCCCSNSMNIWNHNT
jgi:hypothetical protein